MRAGGRYNLRLDRRGCWFDPSGAMLGIERGGEPTAGLFCLRERADAAVAQLRKQGMKMRAVVTASAVAV